MNKILLIIVSGLFLSILADNRSIESVEQYQQVEISPSPIPTTTPTPSIAPSPTTLPKVVKKTPNPTPNPDAPITCNARIGSHCEGQSINSTKVECETKVTCCNIENSTWKLASRDICKDLQKNATPVLEAFTLPHNSKLVYCPRDVGQFAYNMSSKLRDEYEEKESWWDATVLYDYVVKSDQVITDYMRSNHCNLSGY